MALCPLSGNIIRHSKCYYIVKTSCIYLVWLTPSPMKHHIKSKVYSLIDVAKRVIQCGPEYEIDFLSDNLKLQLFEMWILGKLWSNQCSCLTLTSYNIFWIATTKKDHSFQMQSNVMIIILAFCDFYKAKWAFNMLLTNWIDTAENWWKYDRKKVFASLEFVRKILIVHKNCVKVTFLRNIMKKKRWNRHTSFVCFRC